MKLIWLNGDRGQYAKTKYTKGAHSLGAPNVNWMWRSHSGPKGFECGSDDISEGGVAAVLEIDSVITGRVKYGMSLGDKASGYLSAGYSNVGISAAACAVGTCFADSDDVSGATLGLGVDFKFGQKWGGTVEFVRGLGDLEDSNVGVFSVKYFLD